MEDLQGYVEHIVFRNADNGYTVLNLISEEDEITCVGIFPCRHGGGDSFITWGIYITSDLWRTVSDEIL